MEPWQGHRSAAELLKAYGKQTVRNVVRPFPVRPGDLRRSFRPWWRSNRIHQQFSPIADRVPWMSFGAIRHLDRELGPGARVFEYGVGGSSVFFLDRGAKVTSVESNAEWARNVQQASAAAWTVHVIPADEQGDDPEYRSTMIPGSFRKYAEAIDGEAQFDVIVVDGFARPACMRHAVTHLAPGGMMVLDNSERPGYDEAAAEFDALGWTREDYFGPGPYNLFFWRTTIWTRPAA